MSIEKVYTYKDVEYKSAYAVKTAILDTENKAIPKEPEEGKEEFWAQYGVTYTETEIPDKEPSREWQLAHLTDLVKEYLDSKAQELDYDSIATACTYVDCGNEKFESEALAFKSWRTAVWVAYYEIIDALADTDEIPSFEEIKERLPEFSLT